MLLDLTAIDFAAPSTPYGPTGTSGPSASSNQRCLPRAPSPPVRSGQRAAQLGPRGRRNFRIVQSRAWEAEREIHCYVGDPGVVLAATVAWRRKRTLARIFLLLLCLGVDICWMKALLGESYRWVALSLPARKCTNIVKETDELLDVAAMA